MKIIIIFLFLSSLSYSQNKKDFTLGLGFAIGSKSGMKLDISYFIIDGIAIEVFGAFSFHVSSYGFGFDIYPLEDDLYLSVFYSKTFGYQPYLPPEYKDYNERVEYITKKASYISAGIGYNFTLKADTLLYVSLGPSYIIAEQEALHDSTSAIINKFRSMEKFHKIGYFDSGIRFFMKNNSQKK